MAVLAVVAIVASVIVIRATAGSASSKAAACSAIRGDIEIQAELWRHNCGDWPAVNLTDIGVDVNYFPSGVPLCPVTGGGYMIDSAGRVVGHNH
jgi:hypothetical protein